MIKIQAQRRAYFNGEIIRAGQILTIASNKVPSWAKRIGKETPEENVVKDENTNPAGEQQQLDINPDGEVEKADAEKEEVKEETPEPDAQEQVEILDDLAGKTDAEILAILDDLITKGIEVGVVIEDADKKTSVEQIIELRKLIEEKKQ